MSTRTPARLVTTTSLAALLCGLAACGADDGQPGGAGTSTPAASVTVAASFYPLAHAVERVGGERVDVENLTGPGQDPHHVELSPQQVGTVTDADVVVWLKGMQPAADDAIESAQPQHSLDLSDLATLPADATETIGGEDGHGHDHGHDHSAEDGHDHGPNDPHFWLDPQLYAQAVGRIEAELAAVDPEGAQTYAANADAFEAELGTLDGEFQQGLAQCVHEDVITGHTSFAYLTQRYGLTQVGISGVLNSGEPDAGRVAAVSDYVRSSGVSTVYAERGETRSAVETVASEAGVETGELDNVAVTAEGGYVDRMQTNLDTLISGQSCS